MVVLFYWIELHGPDPDVPQSSSSLTRVSAPRAAARHDSAIQRKRAAVESPLLSRKARKHKNKKNKKNKRKENIPSIPYGMIP